MKSLGKGINSTLTDEYVPGQGSKQGPYTTVIQGVDSSVMLVTECE